MPKQLNLRPRSSCRLLPVRKTSEFYRARQPLLLRCLRAQLLNKRAAQRLPWLRPPGPDWPAVPNADPGSSVGITVADAAAVQVVDANEVNELDQAAIANTTAMPPWDPLRAPDFRCRIRGREHMVPCLHDA